MKFYYCSSPRSPIQCRLGLQHLDFRFLKKTLASTLGFILAFECISSNSIPNSSRIRCREAPELMLYRVLEIGHSKISMDSKIDWEFEAYPTVGDLAMAPVFALMFPIVRFLLDRLLLERLGRQLVLSSFEGLHHDEQKDCMKKHVKFKESAWKCLYFLSALFFALAVIYKESWFTNTQMFWVGPGEQVWPDQKVKTKLKTLYIYTAGFYMYSILAILFWETRRSDFVVTVIHHVTTAVLIMLAYGLSYEVLLTLDKRKYKDEPVYYYFFNTLLICLLVFNIYWWVLICRVLVKQIRSRGKVVEDVRSGGLRICNVFEQCTLLLGGVSMDCNMLMLQILKMKTMKTKMAKRRCR